MLEMRLHLDTATCCLPSGSSVRQLYSRQKQQNTLAHWRTIRCQLCMGGAATLLLTHDDDKYTM